MLYTFANICSDRFYGNDRTDGMSWESAGERQEGYGRGWRREMRKKAPANRGKPFYISHHTDAC